jgi:citrate lyase beta subunit/acyl dehydratase
VPAVESAIVVSLVVPGHAARMHEKALATSADEVVFDLEDAVAAGARAAAREQIATTLARAEWGGRAVAVRVNAPGSPELALDLELCAALGHPRLTIVVPKVEGVDDVAAAAAIAPVQALVESPQGLAVAARVAAHERVVALILGYADLAAALGRRGAEHDDARWLVAQETLLAAARIGGVAAVDGPSFALRDTRAVAASARAARELGFDAKWAIHPAQLAPIRAEFGASAAERDWAERVKRAVAEAAAGGGAAAAVDGAMVDEAMVRRAERLLALPPAPAGPAPPPARSLAAPYFDELPAGARFSAPGLTLTEGHAAQHQAIVGDRLRLALDADLYAAVTGTPGLLAHPMLVCDVSIGQSTAPSMRVLGNLFYRGLGARPIPLGTTLRTTTEVVGRRATSGGRGIVVLHVRTVDGRGAPVVDYHRAPLLPARADPGDADDDPGAFGAAVDAATLVPRGWDLGPLRAAPLGPLFAELRAGDAVRVEAGETVTGAPGLARLSLNIAHAHTDAGASAHGTRLVYGGHVIGIAAAHVTRVLPDLATILAWESCDHTGPTFEGDRLHSRVELGACEPLGDGGLVRLRVTTTATGADDTPRDVLDWRLVGLMP